MYGLVIGGVKPAFLLLEIVWFGRFISEEAIFFHVCERGKGKVQIAYTLSFTNVCSLNFLFSSNYYLLVAVQLHHVRYVDINVTRALSYHRLFTDRME